MAINRFDSRQTKLASATGMIGSAANDTLESIFPKINDELAKLYEDKNILLTDGGIVNYLGTTVTFTEDLNIVLNSKISGASPQIISLASTTRTISATGKMIYAVINRTAGTATVTDDATTLPAVTSANQEVFLIAKRIDAGDGTKRLYFRNGTVLNEGQAIRLGAGGGGSSSTIVVAGENLTLVDAVYVSKGNANGDTSRTTGQAYKLDASNDNRMEFVGFATQTVSAAANITVQTGGELDGFTGLTVGLPLWANSASPGGYTQTAPSTLNTWLIPLGIAVSTTKVIINAAGSATAIYLESPASSFTVPNNSAAIDVTGLSFSGASHRAMIVTFSLRRKTDTALSEVEQVGTIRCIYNTQTATYNSYTEYTFDDCGATFTITAGGQIQVATTNIAGANYVGEMQYSVQKFAVGV